MKNLDISLLPPCKRTLEQLLKRVNYQVRIWKLSHKPYADIQEPELHGWKVEDGILRPHWFDGADMPTQLTDIAVGKEVGDEEGKEVGDDEEEYHIHSDPESDICESENEDF